MLMSRGHHLGVKVAAITSLIGACTLYAFTIWCGNLNQDEGWYLYAARSWAAGMFPYRDFFFTQGSVMPCIYGAFAWIWEPYGVLGGRVLTAIFGLSSCFCAAGLAWRAVPLKRAAEAGILAFVLTACNIYHVYYTTIPKTYALASCFLLSGYWLLSFCLSRRTVGQPRMLCLWALPAGFLVALSAGTRLSLVVLLPITVIGLLIQYRKTGMAYVWFAVGGVLGLLLAYGGTLWNSWDAFLFSQQFHATRGGRSLFYIIGSLSRSLRAYLPLFLLGVTWVVFRVFFSHKVGMQNDRTRSLINPYWGSVWPSLWACGFLAVFLFQLISPFPYDDYQVPIMGLLVAALAGWVANSIASDALRKYICLVVVIISLVNTCASPLIQEWFVVRQDRFWSILKKESDLALLRRVACEVRTLAETDKVLLTQDIYLAVETGMQVPKGFEMGPFSYFPELSDADALRYHVLNKARLIKVLETAQPCVAAYSGYSFSIHSPVMSEVTPEEQNVFLSVLSKHYDCVQEVPNFGQNSTTLRILKRRNVRKELSL